MCTYYSVPDMLDLPSYYMLCPMLFLTTAKLTTLSQI
jgi:hypothetical protein